MGAVSARVKWGGVGGTGLCAWRKFVECVYVPANRFLQFEPKLASLLRFLAPANLRLHLGAVADASALGVLLDDTLP